MNTVTNEQQEGQGGEMAQQPPENQAQQELQGRPPGATGGVAEQMANEGQEGAEQQGGEGGSQSQ